VIDLAAVLSFGACWVGAGHRRAPNTDRELVRRSHRRTDAVAGPVVRVLTCVLGGGVVGAVFAGPVGLVAGVLAGVGAAVGIGRLEPATVRRERERAAADLPLALDLLAASPTPWGDHSRRRSGSWRIDS
jgi:hypothetical protein